MSDVFFVSPAIVPEEAVEEEIQKIMIEVYGKTIKILPMSDETVQEILRKIKEQGGSAEVRNAKTGLFRIKFGRHDTDDRYARLVEDT